LELEFSDHTQGVFDAGVYLATRSGPLLDKLRDPAYFSRVFIDADALCWPNGLELSPATQAAPWGRIEKLEEAVRACGIRSM
jgi:hypothetical protein